MERLENIHPGEILLEEFMLPYKLTAYRLAKSLEIPQTRISQIIKGKRRITADTALRLSSFFGNSAKFWLGIQNDYDIEEIDGIGKGYGKRLRAMGIHTTTKLLNKCTNTDYEKNIAKAMMLNEKIVKSWCQMADLIRVEGIDGQLADLLFFSGITSVKELSIKDADKLTSKIESVNKAQQRMKETPTQEMVSMWIASAQSLCK